MHNIYHDQTHRVGSARPDMLAVVMVDGMAYALSIKHLWNDISVENMDGGAKEGSRYLTQLLAPGTSRRRLHSPSR